MILKILNMIIMISIYAYKPKKTVTMKEWRQNDESTK